MKFPDGTGAGGTANPPAVTGVDIPINGEVSENQEALNAKIDAELGIPSVPVKPEDAELPSTEPDEPAPEAEPETPAGEEEPTPAEEETPEEETPEEEPAPTPPAQPTDEELFIEVEDAEGVTHKITKIEDLPDDFSPKNNRQILEIIRATDKLEGDIAKRDADREEAAAAQAVQETQQAQFRSWDAEITELAKTSRVDVKDTDRINDVFGYMNEINTARQKAGNTNFVTSFEDALEKFEAKETRDKAEAAKKNDNERAKVKASLIGRSSAAANGEQFVYRSGQFKSIDDIPVG